MRQRLYLRNLPNVYSKILELIILPLGDVFLRTFFTCYLKQCRANDLLTELELENLQKKRLKKILSYVSANSPYYRSLNISVDLENPVQTLKQFPILTKALLKENKKTIPTRDISKLNKLSSSGSSGVQSTVFLSNREISIIRAQQTRWWEWAGYRLGDRLLQTGMATNRSMVKKIKDYLLRTQYVHAFAPSADQIEHILNKAVDNSILHFYGYSSSLFVFAEVAERKQMDVKFNSLVSWGDKMFNHYREKIETVFKGDLKETYGCTEGFMIASQYDLPYLYVMTPWLYLELLDENGNEVEDGEIGQVVVTSLFAKSFPLIRYKLGDLAIRLPREKYPSSRKFNYPLLQQVIGRDTDIVKLVSGKSLIVHSFTGIFEYYPEIRQFQVVQKAPGKIIIKYIPENISAYECLEEIRIQINELAQEEMSILFEEVDYIKPSGSGKPQIIKSELEL